jgi:acetyl esterase
MTSSAPYLDPVNQIFVDELAKQLPLADASIEDFRAIFETIQEHKPTSDVTRTSFTIPFEDGVESFIFRPSDAAKKTLVPVVFYFHGGAWIGGRCVQTILSRTSLAMLILYQCELV